MERLLFERCMTDDVCDVLFGISNCSLPRQWEVVMSVFTWQEIGVL